MKSKLIILFLIGSLQKSISQAFTPLSFENFNPLWTRISKTDKLPLNLQSYELEQGFGNAPLVIQKGVMYNLYNVVNSYYDGYFLESVDLNSGNLLWEDSYLGFKRNTRKIGLHPSFNDHTLQLPILAENDPPEINLWPLWFQAKAEKNTYDIQTGKKIDSTSNYQLDSVAKPLGNYYSFIQNKFRDRIYAIGDNYKYIVNKSLFNSGTLEGLIQYELIHLSQTGVIIDSIGLDIITKYPVSINHLIDLEDKTLFSFSVSELGSDSNYVSQPFFHIINRQLEILEKGDLTEKLPKSKANRYTISYTDTTNFNILTYQQTVTNETQYTFLSCFNRIGNLLETIDLIPLNLINNLKESHTLQSTILNENNIVKTLFCVSNFENGKYEFTFYKTDGKGNYTVLKKLVAKNEKKEAIDIRRIYQIGKNVLCLFSYTDQETRTNPVPTWACWVMISGEDFEVNVNDYSNNISENDIFVYPNPVLNKLILKNQANKIKKILIYNNNGKCVLFTKKFENELNIENLISGNYYLYLEFINGRSKVYKFLKN